MPDHTSTPSTPVSHQIVQRDAELASEVAISRLEELQARVEEALHILKDHQVNPDFPQYWDRLDFSAAAGHAQFETSKASSLIRADAVLRNR